MKRVYVVVPAFDGSPRFYCRHQSATDPRDGRPYSQPFFVESKTEAKVLDEDWARIFVRTLRTDFGVANVWLESTTGERIDVPRDDVAPGEDTRQPMIASLNDIDFYIVRPCATPNGRQWFASAYVPGATKRQTVYANSPLEVLERLDSLGWLQLLEKYAMPAPPELPKPTGPRSMLRPGDRY